MFHFCGTSALLLLFAVLRKLAQAKLKTAAIPFLVELRESGFDAVRDIADSEFYGFRRGFSQGNSAGENT